MAVTRSEERQAWGEMTRQYVPLAVSDMVMALQAPIIAAGVARLPGAEVNLAAYSAALSIGLLIESPVMTLLQTATALGTHPARFRMIRRLTLGVSIAVTLAAALVLWAPVARLVFEGWLGLVPEVAAATRRIFAWLLLWPAFIAWRRTYQGVLINQGHARDIGLGSAGRLSALALLTWAGTMAGRDGATVAGTALIGGVFFEMLLVVVMAQYRMRRGALWNVNAASAAPAATGLAGKEIRWNDLLRFFLPLASTSVMMTASRPLITAGLARAAAAETSLAAWPIVWTTVMFFGNGCKMIQQLAIVWIQDGRSYILVRRFATVVGVIMTGGFFLLAFTGAGRVYLEHAIGLPEALHATALDGMRGMVLFPAFIAVQSWWQAFLVKEGRTAQIHLAAIADAGLLVLVLFTLASRTNVPGLLLASAATVLGLVVELALLARFSKGARQAVAVRVAAGAHAAV